MNKFKEWLDRHKISPLAFSRMIGITSYTIYKAYEGEPITKLSNARKIAKWTKGEITMADLLPNNNLNVSE